MTVPVCAALGTTWRARGWVRTHRWTNNGPEGGSRLLRWDGSKMIANSGVATKTKGQFFAGRVLKVEVAKAAAGLEVAKAAAAGGKKKAGVKTEKKAGGEAGGSEEAGAGGGPPSKKAKQSEKVGGAFPERRSLSGVP